MSLLALSASHDQLGLDGLQKFTGAHRIGAEIARHPGVRGALVLATCNRFEVYVDADGDEDVAIFEAVRDVIAEGSDEASAAALTELRNEDAVQHLFRVTSGLESMIVGEREIRGQVRRALGLARRQGTTSDVIERLASGALSAASAVGESTELGNAGRSAVDVALQLAGRTDWPDVRAVLVGTGSYAGVSVARLRGMGVRDIAVHSVSGRAADFAASHGVVALERDGLVEAMADADVVVACRGHDVPSVLREDVSRALAGRDRAVRPLTVLDLSLRRDVEDGVEEFAQVISLEDVSRAAPEAVREHVEMAERVVGDALEEFHASRAERTLDDAIVEMRKRAEAVLERELERLPEGPVDVKVAQQALRRLTNTLLHVPTARAHAAARAGEDATFRRALTAIFGLDEEN